MQTIRFENFNFFPDQKILDIGCGQGRHCFGAYMHADLHVYGIDMGLDDVKKANENFNQFKESENEKSCNFMVGNAKNLPFAENTFDHVVCSEVLEHIIDYESALKEIKRVLKPDGTFALSVPKFFPEWVCWKLSKDYQNEPRGHVRIFKYKELKNSVSTLGFKFYKKALGSCFAFFTGGCNVFFGKLRINQNLLAFTILSVSDMTKNPFITRLLEFLLQPIIGKSVVMYFQNIEGEIER